MQNALTVIKIGSHRGLRRAGPRWCRPRSRRTSTDRSGADPRRPARRLRGRDDRGALDLRRLVRPHLLGGRDARSRAQPAARADPRHGGGDRCSTCCSTWSTSALWPCRPWRRRRASPRRRPRVLFGPGAARLISLAVLVSTFGCLSATILYSSRIYLPMAEDGLFFRSLARVDPTAPDAGRQPLGADRLVAGAHLLGELLAALHLRRSSPASSSTP